MLFAKSSSPVHCPAAKRLELGAGDRVSPLDHRLIHRKRRDNVGGRSTGFRNRYKFDKSFLHLVSRLKNEAGGLDERGGKRVSDYRENANG